MGKHEEKMSLGGLNFRWEDDIMKWISKKGVKVWSWAYWIKIECIGWLLWAFRFHGMKRVY
jgi:hypothetical protein